MGIGIVTVAGYHNASLELDLNGWNLQAKD